MDANNPTKLTIETTSVCNLRCVMCPQAIGAIHRPKHLPESMVQRLEPALRSAKYVELHGIGEPLLSPAFWRMLAILKENPDCEAVVNSNLVVLSDKMLEDVATSTLLQISVSLDAASDETYRKIRGADFAIVTANVRRLAYRLQQIKNGRRPKLVLNMTVMRENLAEVPAFARLAKSLGADEAIVWPINDYGLDDKLMRTWETNLRDWRFVYREQLLTGISDQVTAIITETMSIAHEIGLNFIASNLTSEQRAAA